MKDWPHLLAFVAVYVAFLTWNWDNNRRQLKARLNGDEPPAGFWNEDLLQFKTFRIAATVLCLIFLIILFVSAGAVFGAMLAIAGVAAVFAFLKMCEWFQDRMSCDWEYKWAVSMLKDGWYPVSPNRWESKYWDDTAGEMRTYVLFTGNPVPKRLSKAKRDRIRRHPSSIAIRKRRSQ